MGLAIKKALESIFDFIIWQRGGQGGDTVSLAKQIVYNPIDESRSCVEDKYVFEKASSTTLKASAA